MFSFLAPICHDGDANHPDDCLTNHNPSRFPETRNTSPAANLPHATHRSEALQDPFKRLSAPPDPDPSLPCGPIGAYFLAVGLDDARPLSSTSHFRCGHRVARFVYGTCERTLSRAKTAPVLGHHLDHRGALKVASADECLGLGRVDPGRCSLAVRVPVVPSEPTGSLHCICHR